MLRNRKGISNYPSLLVFMTLAILFAVLYFGSVDGWFGETINQFISTSNQYAIE